MVLSRTRVAVRWALRALLALLALVLVVPLALGASMQAYAVTLAGGEEHVCKCGMEKGECGCPECNGDPSSASREGPSCGDCGGDHHAQSATPIDPVILPPSVTGRLPAAEAVGFVLLDLRVPAEDPSRSPPTPPPRSRRS